MKKLMMTFGVWCLVLGADRALGAEPVEYLDWNGEKLVPATCSDYEVVADGANAFAAGKTYVVQGEVSPTSRITVNGTVKSPTRLILCDGAKLTAAQGINVASDRAFVICGQSEGTGALVATSGDSAAGIGGGNKGAGGTVTINGGTVTAKGGDSAAGIGGGNKGAGGAVTINGGVVTATGGDFYGAGIGGGDKGAGGTVTVNGGTVIATSGKRSAGIGGGWEAVGGTVTINGGTVTAQGSDYGAGIGGGERGAGGTVTINGGVVTVTGGPGGGAGIGGGAADKGGKVVIRNGAVKVVAGLDAAVIGHGRYNTEDGSVSVLGGIFGMKVSAAWLAEHRHAIDNPDPETKADYPYQVVILYKLTIPQVKHATVQVTTNGTVVAGFAGNVDVLINSKVRVAFAADPDYRIVANGEKEWVIVGDVTFGTTPGFPLPTIIDARLDLWQVGEDVVAYTNANGVLTIIGTGAMDDFASAAVVPWNPARVTAVTIEEGVTKIGANAWAGLSGDVMVNGEKPLSSYALVAGGFVPAEPVIPEGMALVSKTELEAAGAETVEIVGGMAYLGVSVKTNGDLKAETKIWGNVNIQPDDVSFENGSVIIAVPANAEKGFMVLESGK